MHEEYAVVIVDQLNVRSRPGSDDKDIVGKLTKGTRVRVVGRRAGEQAQWLQISWDKPAVAWIAERSNGKVYVRVERVEKPVPPPRPKPPEKPYEPPPDPWSLVILWGSVSLLVLVPLLAWLTFR